MLQTAASLLHQMSSTVRILESALYNDSVFQYAVGYTTSSETNNFVKQEQKLDEWTDRQVRYQRQRQTKMIMMCMSSITTSLLEAALLAPSPDKSPLQTLLASEMYMLV